MRPRLGLVGVGWIGRMCMKSLVEGGWAEVVALCDPSEEMRAAAHGLAPAARACASLEELLELPLDGVVIASPSALHAEQSRRALERGAAVFCQTPLGRDLAETRAVVELAQARDRLLAVDLCYRHTRALRALHELVTSGELGDVYAADLVFHNAYGPDKPWFRRRSQSGGGCVMDLGTHLVDAALWLFGSPELSSVRARLFTGGRPLPTGTARDAEEVEDYALVHLDLDGRSVQLACSWNLPAGRDAIIELRVYGTRGGAAFRNVDGSFFDFVCERYRSTSTETLVAPPDDWSGRALDAWARQLGRSPRFDPSAQSLLELARIVDAIYGR